MTSAIRNETESPIPVHALSETELFSVFDTTPNGLTTAQANAHRERFGPNEISHARKRSILLQFLDHFRNLFILILLFAAVVSLFMGETTDAIIIVIIILASVTLDFYQEYRAEEAAELLRQKIQTRATVYRDGKKQDIPIFELVPGDLVFLSAGDIVPADARVIQARDFFLNQSVLTGEPYPVEKRSQVVNPAKPVTEAENIIFLGTSVVSGTAHAIIVRTGMGTEFGRIAKTLVARPPETEFERGLKQFSYLMTKIVFFLVIFVFFINALFRHGVLDSLLFAVALAVGLTPELLPMILSLNLSKGSIAMSKKGAIVKHPAAIQNFGSMDILCTDKTGTLTENRITLIRHLDSYGRDNNTVLLYSYINSSFQTGLKSPLDEAILVHQRIDLQDYQKIEEIPFDFIRKRLSIAISHGPERTLITKGAPEEILGICSKLDIDGTVRELLDDDLERITHLYQELSEEGFRSLAVCYRSLTTEQLMFSPDDEQAMTFLGLISFLDPPKESARESLRMLLESGIALKILTGDNDLVTRKTCERIGLEVTGILSGGEIQQMDGEALSRVVEDVTLFYRVTPVQKNRVIAALRRNGHVVGFLGDGINDAPSIREADVGISVENAVDIARESADIILLQQDLRILNDGVREGRKTFGNTMKYLLMGTSSNFGNMFSVAGASFFLPFLPMLPVQILLNNLLYDISESTIPTDNVDESYVRCPKRWDMDFIKRFILIFGPISSFFDFLTFFLLLFVFGAGAALFQTAWFIESISTQALVIFVIRTRIVPFYKSSPSKLLVASTFLVLAVAFLLPFTILGTFFGFVQPPLTFFAVLITLAVGYLSLVELTKRWFYRNYSTLTEK